MLKLNANIRKKIGKNNNRRLHVIKKFPGIIYGKNKNSILIELYQNEVLKIKNKNDFYHNPSFILVNNRKIKVLFKDIQMHPFKKKIIHIDFIFVE